MCLKSKSKAQAAQVDQSAAANAAMLAQVQATSETNRLAAEKASADALAQAKAQTDALNAQIAAQATAQSEAARQSAESIGKMQESLLAGQRDAAAAAELAMKNVGQKAKAPNIAGILQNNKRANAKGLGSTMLTGSKGVDSSTLALSRNTLLGL